MIDRDPLLETAATQFLRHAVIVCAAACPLAVICASPAHAEHYDFKVFCNGNPVGYQHVQVERGPEETEVETEISVDVSMAGIALYRYRHRSHETWREGRLIELASQTDDDGEALSLAVHPADDGMLVVESNEGTREIPADTLPTSYWNPAVLERSELLDTESGKTVKVKVAALSDERYDVSGDLNMRVDYHSGHWNGVKFRYFGANVDFLPEGRTAMSGEF